MALFFLALAPALREALGQAEYHRLEVICGHLKDNFKAGKNQDQAVFKKVNTALQAEGIPISRTNYTNYKDELRVVYLVLSGATDEERTKAKVRAGALGGRWLQCLNEAGINTWAGVLAAHGSPPPALTACPPPQASAPPAPPPRREWKAGGEMAELAGAFFAKLEAVLEENEALKSEAGRLAAELAESAHEAERAKDYSTFLEQDCADLEKRLTAARESLRQAHDRMLEEIALEHPEEPRLLEIVQRIRNEKGRKEQKREQLAARLPKSFAWASQSGAMQYEKRFLDQLADLSAGEQSQVIGQLETLAAHGAEYASLHTRKAMIRIPFSPPGCFTSRSADNIRFSWSKQNGSAVVVHWLYRKGDSRVRESEA